MCTRSAADQSRVNLSCTKAQNNKDFAKNCSIIDHLIRNSLLNLFW